MNVTGYVVRFCTAKDCPHDDASSCSNVPHSKYYLSPAERLDIAGKPLVVAHNDGHVIGECVLQVATGEGILLKCSVDDVYFMEMLRRRFDDFKDNYNATIPDFETFCKKTLCSFSLSHNAETKTVRHVSLVDTPGRIGTAVDYSLTAKGGLLKRREGNEFISDIVASHSTAYVPQGDRRSYLLQNDRFSHSSGDLCYINATRALRSSTTTNMSAQDDFNEMSTFFRLYKMMKNQSAAKRPRTKDDAEEDLERVEPSCKRARWEDTDVSASAARASDDREAILTVVKEGIQQAIAATLHTVKEQTPEAIAAPTVTPVRAPQQGQLDTVDAAKQRATTITFTPSHETLGLLVDHIMGV